MNRRSCILLLAVAALTLSWANSAGAQAKPSGELVWALHVSLSPSWFDPGENGGLIRLAVNYALNRQAVSEAACLSYCPPAGVIVPRLMDFALPTEPFPYDPQKAKQLLSEAGYPNGFDAGELMPIPPFFEVGEAVVNELNAIGIRVRMGT